MYIISFYIMYLSPKWPPYVAEASLGRVRSCDGVAKDYYCDILGVPKIEKHVFNDLLGDVCFTILFVVVLMNVTGLLLRFFV